MQSDTNSTAVPKLSMQGLKDLIAGELRLGRGQESAIGILSARGWPDVTARQFVARVAQEMEAQQQANPPAPADLPAEEKRRLALMVYKRRMVRGVLWLVGGLAISAASLGFARANGNGSFIFWGAMIFGVIDFLAGFLGYWRSRK